MAFFHKLKQLLCEHASGKPSGPALRVYETYSENPDIKAIQLRHGVKERRFMHKAICDKCGKEFTATRIVTIPK